MSNPSLIQKQMKRPKYRFYATLLDAFYDYLDSSAIYQKYWGFSDKPPFTEEEFHDKQFNDLINKINRVPFTSEAASKGTAFNEVIDCIIDHRKSKTVDIKRVESNDTVTGVNATLDGMTFFFPLSLVREFSDYYKGALTQQRVEAILPTAKGDALVYGIIDELMPMSVHDIKTTGKYSSFKFRSHSQHLVYPYALIQNGNDIRTFEYNIVELGKYGYETYTETYVFDPERDIPILTDRCEQLIDFIEENRNRITDKKIFGEI